MEFVNSPGSSYTIYTDVYEGPLDLLLDLITKAELEITRLALAKVTDQYLLHLQRMQEKSAVEVSGFLIIAAKLIQIKSEALLPRPPIREEGEEDPAETLARQLRIYREIKNVASWLKSMEEKGQHTYIRLAPPPIIDEELDLKGITIDDLVEMLRTLYRFEEAAAPITTVVTIPRVTIKNKIGELIDHLRKTDKLSYRNLLNKDAHRIDAIVLFLAILEMVKQNYALAEQESLFSDINITATEKTFLENELQLALDD
ncbi:MAG: segregation/condensation protein A [Chloroflexota bacterium]|nr:segregation/condensation protein A [Chloroflexota bacterium]